MELNMALNMDEGWKNKAKVAEEQWAKNQQAEAIAHAKEASAKLTKKQSDHAFNMR